MQAKVGPRKLLYDDFIWLHRPLDKQHAVVAKNEAAESLDPKRAKRRRRREVTMLFYPDCFVTRPYQTDN